MEGFNQPPQKKAKTAKGEVASKIDTGENIEPVSIISGPSLSYNLSNNPIG
jgi:hypothetical protein